MDCLVTGATGHIGNVLVRKLLKEHIGVRALVLPTDDLGPLSGLPVEIVRGSVCNPEEIKAACQGVEVVFHLAGIIGIGSGGKKQMMMVNVEGVKNVVQACVESGVNRLVYVSSVHAIEEAKDGQVIRETLAFSPDLVHGTYAKTKAIATGYVLSECAARGLEVVVVHPSGVIGPYESQLSNMGQLILNFSRGKLPAYIGGAYDFVDVRDVANGIYLASKHGKNGDTYILSGERLTVPQMLEYLEEITGIRAPRLCLPYIVAKLIAPFAEMYSRIARQKPVFTSYSISTLRSNSNFSNEKARSCLGFQTTPLSQTLRDTVSWLQEHGKKQ